MPSPTPDTPRVLLVNPDTEEGRYLSLVLEEHGFDVLWAHDADSAFEVLDREPIAAVVAELIAPRIDGLRILDVARARPALHNDAVNIATQQREQGQTGSWSNIGGD